MSKKHIMRFAIGDWSDDGHGKFEEFYVKTSLSQEEIKKAYKAATEKLGFDFCEEVAVDYEDSSIPREYIEKLRSNGIKYKWEGDENTVEDEDGKTYISLSKDYLEIYLFIVKLGNSDFDWEYISGKFMPVGGYGLYR